MVNSFVKIFAIVNLQLLKVDHYQRKHLLFLQFLACFIISFNLRPFCNYNLLQIRKNLKKRKQNVQSKLIQSFIHSFILTLSFPAEASEAEPGRTRTLGMLLKAIALRCQQLANCGRILFNFNATF